MNRYNGTFSFQPSQAVTFVGYGNTGEGWGGVDDDTTGTKRGGQNQIDQSWEGVLSTDFDSTYSVDRDPGIGVDYWYPHNYFDNVAAGHVPRPLEAGLGGGDSGGPWIVDGRIAGVHSGSPFGHDQYGTVEQAPAVSPHNNWINQTMGGVNWNTRASTLFHTSSAWGDGRIPTGNDVQFSLPNIPGSVPGIRFNQNSSVANVQVDGRALSCTDPYCNYKDIYLELHEFGQKGWITVQLSFDVAIVNQNVFPLDIPEVLQPLPESGLP